MKNNQRHDRFFKHHFSHKEQVGDFLKGRLASELLRLLDLATLEKKEDAFLGNRTRGARRADVIWSVQTKNREELLFFFHFEGQSSHDALMAVRTLEYHTGIVRRVLEAGYKKCPPIFTFVIYHGSRRWKSARSIAELFANFDLYLEYGIKRDFLIEPALATTQELKKDGLAFCAELVLAKQPTGAMKSIVPEVVDSLKNAKNCCTEETYNYLADYNKKGEEEVLDEIVKFDPNQGTKFRTMFERAMRKYERKGMQKGIEKGKLEGMKEAIQKLLHEGIINDKQAQKSLKELF